MSLCRVMPVPKIVIECLLSLLLALLLVTVSGCQKLFHEEGAPLKGQTVNLAVTVPETPPPASKPLPAAAEPESKPLAPLPARLLPTRDLESSPPQYAAGPAPAPPASRVEVVKADMVLAERTLTEDTVLRGTVLVRGSLIVAPHATLRLEPGASLHFQRPANAVQNPRLVIQGRLVVAGTQQKPVVISSAFKDAQAADWGGILLLSTEKKNSLDHCRIEGAETGVEARYSQFSGRGLEVVRSREGIALYDSIASLQSTTISRCDVGLVVTDSELDLRSAFCRENRIGIAAVRSSVHLATVTLRGNSQEGLVADQCRFKLSGCSADDNRIGLLLKGGEGQVQQCRLTLNREAGLVAAGSRLKVTYSTFQDNLGVGLRVEGARGSVTQSVFTRNRGANLQNTTHEGFAAVLNWWGAVEESRIAAGIQDASRASTVSGRVIFVPFLNARPGLAP